jgi:hypothetical protein
MAALKKEKQEKDRKLVDHMIMNSNLWINFDIYPLF